MSAPQRPHHWLRRADALGDRHLGRMVRVGDVTGQLIGLYPANGQVVLVCIVGAARAIFALDPHAHVEVWRPENEEQHA